MAPWRPYYVLGGAAQEACRSDLLRRLESWQQDWGLAGVEALLAQPQGRPAPRWRRAWQGAAGAVRLGWSEEAPDELRRLLYGQGAVAREGIAPVLAAAVAAQAWDALLAVLAGPGGAGQWAEVKPAPSGPGQGLLRIALQLGFARIEAEWDGALVAAWRSSWAAAPAGLPPLRPVAPAALAQHARLAVQVELGCCSINLAELASVAAGDVLRLERRLDDALLLRVAGGPPLLAALPGRQGEHLAVELQALPAHMIS